LFLRLDIPQPDLDTIELEPDRHLSVAMDRPCDVAGVADVGTRQKLRNPIVAVALQIPAAVDDEADLLVLVLHDEVRLTFTDEWHHRVADRLLAALPFFARGSRRWAVVKFGLISHEDASLNASPSPRFRGGGALPPRPQAVPLPPRSPVPAWR